MVIKFKKILVVFLVSFAPTNVYCQAPANFDFELSAPGSYTSANAVQGWTVESAVNSMSFGGIGCVPNPSIVWTPGSPEFSIVSTPVIGNTSLTPFSVDNINIVNSPLGGNKIARLNNRTSPTSQITRISTQISVSSTFNLLQLAFAGSFEGAHTCCEAAAFRLDIYNCGSTLVPLPGLSHTLTPGSNQCIGVAGFSVNGLTSWTNWQLLNKDLTPYIGQCLKLVITVSDCAFSGHHGSVYFDAHLTNQLLGGYTGGGLAPTGNGGMISFCPGSNAALLQGPLGYSSYQWIAPGGFAIPPPLGNAQTFSFTNPVPGSVYTLQVFNYPVSTVFTYTIFPSQVNIAGIGSFSSCIGGNNGSATVVANGSGTGYNYTWLNSGSVTVGTSSVVSGLAPGNYSVLVTSNQSLACGTASAVLSIGTTSNTLTHIYKPYCGPEAYLCAPPGSNYQWYNNITPISGPAGVAQCFTVTNPSNGALFHVKFNSAQACSDSIKYTLGNSPPGFVSISTNSYACQGVSNGSIVVSMTPALGSPSGQNTFSLFSTGTLNPVYSYSSAASGATSFALSNLPAATYSLISFDGSCKYSNSLTLFPFIKNFTLSAMSTTLCNGIATAAGVSFSVPPTPGQYTYSWSPTTWLPGNNGSLQQTIISPTFTPGSISTIIYTIVVTPSIINCPFTETLSITAVGALAMPTIGAIPLLCNNSTPYTLALNPPGGFFVTSFVPNVPNYSAVLSPSLYLPGSYTLSYSAGIGNCLASNSTTFQIGGPLISLAAVNQVCKGQTITLSATGANSYTWSTGTQSPTIAVSPTVNTIYTVSASHTTDVCTSTRTVLVQVIDPPNLFVSGSTSICKKESTTLQASGAISYTWNTGLTSNTILVSPSITTVYTVSGSSPPAFCVSHKTISIYVNQGPPIQVSGPTLVCIGEQFQLIATGATNYSWTSSQSNWTFTGNSLPSSQLATTIYTILAESPFSNACKSETEYTVSVSECLSLEESKPEFLQMNIYPNPGNGLFTLESDKALDFVILNAQGSILYSGKTDIGKTELDLRSYPQGLYFVECRSGKERRVEKLIKY